MGWNDGFPMPVLAVALFATGGMILLIAEEAESQAIIDNGVIQVGVTLHGAMYGGSTSCSGTTATVVRFMATNCDGTAAGCLCEGWGAAYDSTSSGTVDIGGWCNVATGGCPGSVGAPISSCGFASTPTTAVTCSEFGSMRVHHNWHPNPSSPNLYSADVTLENIGSSAIDHVTYRRVMDWDIEPTPFREYSTINGMSPIDPSVVDFGNNGFRTVNVVSGWGGPGMGTCPTYLGVPPAPYFVDCGPSDHGAQFTFDFGALLPGESFTFRICYGAAADETTVTSTLLPACAAELYSIGQTSTGATSGSPNSFFFGFNGLSPTPTADFDWLPDVPCHDELVSFTDLSLPGAPWANLTSATWYFGDGTPPYGTTRLPADVTHDYDAPGVYTVTLNVTDIEGGVDEISKTITICNDPPVVLGPSEVFVEEGRNLVFFLDHSDPNGDTTSLVKLPGGPSSLIASPATGRVFWATEHADITHPGPPHLVRFAAVDEWGAETQHEVTIHVLPRAPTPDSLQGDADADGVFDDVDNCPLTHNPRQTDEDGDGVGDACIEADGGGGQAVAGSSVTGGGTAEGVGARSGTAPDTSGSDTASTLDSDADGVLDGGDNCVFTHNVLQRDLDGDGIGDACDADIDGDGIHQVTMDGRTWDNCPYTPNPRQEDTSRDGIGDACQGDPDGDLVPTVFDGQPYDNCPDLYNPTQADSDGDGRGDACDEVLDLRPEAPEGSDDMDDEATTSAGAAAVPAGVILGGIVGLVLLGAMGTVALLVRKR